MKVEVYFLQEFIRLAGTHKMTLELPDGSKIRDVLQRLPDPVRKALLDEKGEIRWPAEVAVNGRRIEFLDGLDTMLKDGDRVIVSPRALFVV